MPMNTRHLRGLRALRDIIRELDRKSVEVSLSGQDSQDSFTDRITFSLDPSNPQTVLIIGITSKMELRISGNSIKTVRRLGDGGFKIKLADDKFKSIFLRPIPSQEDD